MVLILFVQVLKKVLKSLKFELKYPGGTLCCKSDPAFIIFILLPFHNPYMLVLIFCLSFCCPLFMIHFPVLELFLLIRFWVYWIKCHMIIKGIVHMKKCSNWHKTCIMLKSQLYFFFISSCVLSYCQWHTFCVLFRWWWWSLYRVSVQLLASVSL